MTKMTIVVIFGFGWCPERFTYGQKFGLQKMVSEPSPPSSHREWSFYGSGLISLSGFT